MSLIFVFVILIASLGGLLTFQNNVCDTFEDYYFMSTSKNCRYNPDVNDMPLLVSQHNYEIETHYVVTKDGYNLTMFRMPNRYSKKVVLLEHPLLASSDIWVDKRNNSLGYKLFHEGFDVWMGNMRGNYYSRQHVTLNLKDPKFWDFSYDEMARYDLPAQINYIQASTGIEQIAYVGHSMGSSVATIYASLYPDEAEKSISIFILMSPPNYFNHATFIFNYIVPYAEDLYKLAKRIKLYQFEQRPDFIVKSFCGSPSGLRLCATLLEFIAGRDSNFIEPSTVPIMLSHFPAGTSVKTLIHFSQAVLTKRFAQFDYGKSSNRKYYKNEQPPEYDMRKIRNAIVIIAGTTDIQASLQDSKDLYNKLINAKRYGFIEIEGYNHYHIVYGKNLDTSVNQKVVKALNLV